LPHRAVLCNATLIVKMKDVTRRNFKFRTGGGGRRTTFDVNFLELE